MAEMARELADAGLIRPEDQEAVAAVLERRLTDLLGSEHVIEVGENGWGLEHPAACRLAGQSLLGCKVSQASEALTSPPKPPGRYKVDVVAVGPDEFRLTFGPKIVEEGTP